MCRSISSRVQVLHFFLCFVFVVGVAFAFVMIVRFLLSEIKKIFLRKYNVCIGFFGDKSPDKCHSLSFSFKTTKVAFIDIH